MSGFLTKNAKFLFKINAKSNNLIKTSYLFTSKFNFSKKQPAEKTDIAQTVVNNASTELVYTPKELKTKEQLELEKERLYKELDYYYGSPKYYEQAKVHLAMPFYAKRRRLAYLNNYFKKERVKTLNVIRYRTPFDNSNELYPKNEVAVKIHAREDFEEINCIMKLSDLHGIMDHEQTYRARIYNLVFPDGKEIRCTIDAAKQHPSKRALIKFYLSFFKFKLTLLSLNLNYIDLFIINQMLFTFLLF